MSLIAEKNGLATVNPATGETIEEYEYISNNDVENIINDCHKAFLSWRLTDVGDRAEIIRSIGKGLQENKSELALLMTREMGKLLKQSKQELDLCTTICEYTADHCEEQLKTEERKLQSGGRGLISYEPLGVIYGIQPWNYPAYQVIRYSIASLAAGNGVLLKHASNVTGTGKFLERVFRESGLPENLFRVLVIDHDQSDEIIKNDLVRGVTLTGSPDAGRKIGEKAGRELKKSVLELGSNDAYIILADADLEKAVKKCVLGRTYNNGETCIAAKRFIVVEDIYEEFKNAFVEAMKSLKTGDPTSEDVKMGPMAREDLREQLHEQVEKSVENGATILCGGNIPEGEGYFYPATVLENVTPGQPAYDDELFGPVASLIKATDEDHAIHIANDSRFGLGGGIFSKNEENAVKLAQNYFDTGMVFINSFGLAEPNMPFGGVKNSGYGREHGGFGIKEFVNVKSVMIGS